MDSRAKLDCLDSNLNFDMSQLCDLVQLSTFMYFIFFAPKFK